ncbi:Amino acid/amide ABC transporter membrane protein 2, HAAT family [Desulfamplus magnetovallimortis]|uniref:Amino acid/amide ABC transporter membrane protein 2, HAAT family n=1 Tax=Desulfamplus magnetovallimortis TaxID=1246637 RepID=A0A1W1HD63_9BACT|nr:branched-chain amino acid ABC transporter permease [Desulfamplus magnetovallimortis]SLM30441.1 Amino acid/amide ABC transporter membrane protein 2, HAAT family [Desulfamplus magnetovallimortis]
MASNRWLATGNFFTTYQEEQRTFTTRLDQLIFSIFLLTLFIWPLLFELSRTYMLVVDNILIAVVAVLGLNLVTGFAGLISIGHAAFVGVGAYTVASCSRMIGDSHIIITHLWPVMIIAGGLAGAVMGAIVGLPALRLKHLYLAIATLSFQMIFEWTINFMAFFNQGQTIFVGRVMWLTGEVGRSDHYVFWYYVILIVIVMCGFGVRNLFKTRYGRALVAVRDNDRAADAMGMHPGLTKVYAFALSGFLAGVAGALHAYLYRGAGIESFTLHHSISYLAMAIVGGLGTLNGSFWGPAAIQFLDLQVENVAELAGHYMPSNMNLATALRPLTFGLVIVLFLMFEPRGIANWWRIVKSYTKTWPFRY